MLASELHHTHLQQAPAAYLIYGKDDRLRYHNEAFLEFFPSFRKEKLIGEKAKDIVKLLEKLDLAKKNEIKKFTQTSKKGRARSSNDGAFELSPGRFFVIEDIALPEGDRLTMVRDVTRERQRHLSVSRMQAALAQIAAEEAIYNGEKDAAFQMIVHTVREALEASRADIWLLNVDATTMHQQVVCWDDGKNHRSIKLLEKSQCPALFEQLSEGHEVAVSNVQEDERVLGLPPKNARDRDTKAVLIIPIRRGPRTIGSIFVADAREFRHWQTEEISFVRSAADLVVRTLEAHDRQVAEEGLRSFNEVLDERVRHRTQELEEALETLKLAQSELVRSEKLASLGGLVAGVAHEINTPLGVSLTSVTHLQDAVSRFGTILESGRIRRSDLADFFEVAKETGTLVQRNLDRAAHLIRSFRMVAVDQAMEDRRTLLLGQYVGEIVDSLKPTLRKHGVLVTLDCVKDIEIKTVPGDLAHILTNLIMNAALHAFKGRKETASKLVRTSVRRRGDYIYIDVADNGTGIPDDIKEKVFDPFFTTARAEGGSGLGLNIVYNTVYQKLGGKIEICDNDGGGTLFKIRFPVDPDAQQKAAKG